MASVAHPTRPQIRRYSPLSASNGLHRGFGDGVISKRLDIGDSDSDDEPPPAIKFSKVTQALLADGPVPSSPPKHEREGDVARLQRSTSEWRNVPEINTPSRAPGIRIVRRSSPAVAHQERGDTPPRIVQVGTRGSASSKRSISISGPYPQRPFGKREPTPTVEANAESITPAPASRALRVHTRAYSNSSQDKDNHMSSVDRVTSRNQVVDGLESDNGNMVTDLGRSASTYQPPDTVARFGASTRSKHGSAEPAYPPNSTRIKRAPIGTGSFLKSGPVRRGFRRRESDDNISPTADPHNASASQPGSGSFTPRDRSATRATGIRSRSGSVDARTPSVEPVSVHDFAQGNHGLNESRPSSRQASEVMSRSRAVANSRPPSPDGSRERRLNRAPSLERSMLRERISTFQSSSLGQHQLAASTTKEPKYSLEPDSKPQRPSSPRIVKLRQPAPKVHTDPAEDQENLPPPTFRRNKDQEMKHLGKPYISSIPEDGSLKPKQIDETPVPVPAARQLEQRKALGAISGNTPHRTAPAPPPKMSVLDAATTTAGASVTKSKKKRSHIVVNGKIFTQLGKLGTGGSSQVYCVMAENYKTFALKRVKLDDCDESAVRGYKGEIDLLKKLTEVERVVRLFDWELNTQKQELSVLMEKGDADLSRLLALRFRAENSSFDPVFTRYHWREMLECVQAVHDMDIVHSDLKPANFLFVQGRLKLIDFGIANAIETDHTVNVHRDTHVGTPNYMSPESITDTNASASKDAEGRPVKKDIKIGKASDVWSLGCILYQMSYGQPPFAHITSQYSRIMAITNPDHMIEFPTTGLGNIAISPSLRGTMRRCLNRDPERRPTIAQLLREDDPYLNPEASGTVIVNEDLLGQIIAKVVERCKDPKRGIPSAEEIKIYPRSFMEKIWDMQQRG